MRLNKGSHFEIVNHIWFVLHQNFKIEQERNQVGHLEMASWEMEFHLDNEEWV